MSPLGAARFGFAGSLVDMEMTFYLAGGGGGGGLGTGHSGWGYFAGSGGGAGCYIYGTGELFAKGSSYTVTIGSGGGGQSTGGVTSMTYEGGTILATGGGRGGNGSGNYAGNGEGGTGGSGGGGGSVFGNTVPYSGGGYNGGYQNASSQTIPAGFTSKGGEGGKGYRGSGAGSGSPPQGASGGSSSTWSRTVNAYGNGAGTYHTELGFTVCAGGNGNTANRGHGGAIGSNNAGGSGFIYILHSNALTPSTTGLTTVTGTYGDYNYIHIKGGTSGTLSFS